MAARQFSTDHSVFVQAAVQQLLQDFIETGVAYMSVGRMSRQLGSVLSDPGPSPCLAGVIRLSRGGGPEGSLRDKYGDLTGPTQILFSVPASRCTQLLCFDSADGSYQPLPVPR